MPGKLSTYHAKRNFRITAEPRGEVGTSAEELRFVVQKHDARKLHYDFRLELEGTLKSWAIPKGPSLDPAEKRLAVQVEDHPIAYAQFEGVIPEHQYGAGTVEIWDSGYWEPEGDPVTAYRAGKLKFRLYGDKLHGGWAFVRTRLQGSGDKIQWLLIKEKDEAAQPSSDNTDAAPVSKATTSSLSRKKKSAANDAEQGTEQSESAAIAQKMKKHAKKNAVALPKTMSAQLATLVEAPPAEGDWEYEIKFDGYRILARIENGRVHLYSRDGKDWTGKLAKQAKALQSLPVDNAWLDGEIVVLDKHGMPSFQLLQNAFDEKSASEIILFVFDCMFLDGADLRHRPLSERRQRLENILGTNNQGAIRYSAPLREPPEKLLQSACQLSMEGIIGKLRDSLYTGKRSSDWIKLKCRKRQEFIIAGFTDPQGKRKYFGSLLLAVYAEDGQLRYAGRVGTGFDLTVLESTYHQLKPLIQKTSPFAHPPKRTSAVPTHWINPQLVAEISFAEWTKDGLVRQAVFHGLRMDKPAEQVRREKATALDSSSIEHANTAAATQKTGNALHDVIITHPDRVIDPSTGLTKFDLAHYYDAVAPYMLPYLKERPVYLLRSPSGISGKAFFQRHAIRTAIPGIDILDPAVDPDHQPLMVINSAKALISAAQMGTIELHSCNARADVIDKPDCMVFDLDPDPNLPWQVVTEAARLTKQLLDHLGLQCFLKTSGSKGLHLVVPLARRHTWEVVTQFSENVANYLARTIPSHFSAKMGEQNRVGKIYIDYLRNQKMASTVVPYSVRARNGLSVSTPIAWDELDNITGSAMWNITSLPARLAELKADPWAEFSKLQQIITKSMRLALQLP
jgi:bifunctional non-homologous end joining protein LigD